MDNTITFAIETIVAEDVDQLVVKGIKYITEHGFPISVTAGTGIQAFGVNYVLLNSRNRVHNLRYPASLRYLCRELLAYFKGSPNVTDGLAQASSFWNRIADNNGSVQSNYGYYVFRQNVGGITQYDWIVQNLLRNPQSRKALCNINQPEHKQFETKDFPCAIAAQFLIREGRVCCEVFSRSEDVIIGLPYDVGFFSFLNELVCADLNRFYKTALGLGYTMVRCSFTQIYDRTAHHLPVLLSKSSETHAMLSMPPIDDVESTLQDIRRGTTNSSVVRWIIENAQLNS